ncbi:MAG: adaptor protein MecA [Oscillospiraceae bacterium]|nr:adaptor protein MecA [Oscillospiraceae bacterium]
MLIEQINKNTVKIHISGIEMKDFNVDYRSIKNNPETENMLAVLMDAIDDSTDMETKGETFFIEAYDQGDNGCVLFISAISENGIENISQVYGLTDVNETAPVYESEDLQSLLFITDKKQVLLDVSNILQTNFGDCIEQSRLYEKNGEYRLVFECLGATAQEIYIQLVEFGELPDETLINLALTYEYYNCIIEFNAIQNILSRNFTPNSI